MPDSSGAPIWRSHPDYDYVMVSDTGVIRTLARITSRGFRAKERVRKQTPDSQGYLSVRLDGVNRKVHQLVLEAFVGPRPAGMETLHSDDDVSNNRLDNLVYGTPSENQLQHVASGRHHEASRDRCIRGHMLVDPNLSQSGKRQGKRKCLACDRGLQWVRDHPGADVQASCDKYYRLT